MVSFGILKVKSGKQKASSRPQSIMQHRLANKSKPNRNTGKTKVTNVIRVN